MLKTIFATSLLLVMQLASAAAPQQGGADAARAADSRPARGMSMDAVRSAFGAPSVQHDPVGPYPGCRADRYCPPITRWDYPGFVVYFEHQYVIHAVATP